MPWQNTTGTVKHSQKYPESRVPCFFTGWQTVGADRDLLFRYDGRLFKAQAVYNQLVKERRSQGLSVMGVTVHSLAAVQYGDIAGESLVVQVILKDALSSVSRHVIEATSAVGEVMLDNIL